MKNPGRFGVRFSDDLILRQLRMGSLFGGDGEHFVRVLDGIPEDAVVIGVTREAEYGGITVWFESPSGDRVPDGNAAPILPIVVERVRRGSLEGSHA